jgi:hypothetical protein
MREPTRVSQHAPPFVRMEGVLGHQLFDGFEIFLASNASFER